MALSARHAEELERLEALHAAGKANGDQQVRMRRLQELRDDDGHVGEVTLARADTVRQLAFGDWSIQRDILRETMRTNELLSAILEELRRPRA